MIGRRRKIPENYFSTERRERKQFCFNRNQIREMAKSLRDETPRSSKSRNVVPSYGPGNSLYSATDCLTEDDIKNYFRILPQRSNSSLSQNENRSTKMSNDEKTFEYLRPTSFEDQQKQMRDSTRNQFDRIPFATFHEKFD